MNRIKSCTKTTNISTYYVVKLKERYIKYIQVTAVSYNLNFVNFNRGVYWVVKGEDDDIKMMEKHTSWFYPVFKLQNKSSKL